MPDTDSACVWASNNQGALSGNGNGDFSSGSGSASGGGGGPAGQHTDKPGCGVNGKGSYGFHCTTKDLDGATLSQRLDWFNWLTQNMDENIHTGTSDWFNNIKTIVTGFVESGQDDNNWVLTVDANILVAVQDGYTSSLNLYSGSSIPPGSGAANWNIFFRDLEAKTVSDDGLIKDWGLAEQAGTNEGMNGARHSWAMLDYGHDDGIFVGVGNVYRSAGGWICKIHTCAGGFFDPRTIWDNTLLGWHFSPVGYVEVPIYTLDYMWHGLNIPTP